jgi:GTPase SAR1 family protein
LTGKSTLINAILKDDLTKEGQNNNFNTQLFKQYSNPNKVPGINIYDTIGFDPIEIKKIIHDIFD